MAGVRETGTMVSEDLRQVTAALGDSVVDAQVLAGGFSHETLLLTLTNRQVVVRLGGSGHAIEATVMAAAGEYVPVPEILNTIPLTSAATSPRSAMVLEYVPGTPLGEVLDNAELNGIQLGRLGAEVGRVAARISSVEFEGPGFFADDQLTVTPQQPWSAQLPEFATRCMAVTPQARLDAAARTAWEKLCATHAPALAGIEHQARLVHSDLNPKNILVTQAHRGWRIAAVLDWEFTYSGCPYADAANMLRFEGDYLPDFRDSFRTAFAAHLPADLEPDKDWFYLGRVLDMFALSDLVTRPIGHPIADRAAQVIRLWITHGVPNSP